MFQWVKALETSRIESIDMLLSVITQRERKLGAESKSNQNGGMRCMFDGSHKTMLNMKGYWKPCTTEYLPSNSETFKSEIIAFHVDRILGFERTPPVIPYYIDVTQMHSLANDSKMSGSDPMAMYKVQTVLDKCGSRKGAEGALVGWSNMQIGPLDE